MARPPVQSLFAAQRRRRAAKPGPVEQFGVLATLSRWRPRVQIPSGPQRSPAPSKRCGAFPYPNQPPDRRPRPRRSRSPAQQIPSGPQSSPVSIIDTGLFRAPPHPRTPAPSARHPALSAQRSAPSPNSPSPRAPRSPQRPSRGLDGVTFARYSKDRASSPCGPLEAAYGGIGQARDAGPAPRTSVGRVAVRPCDAALPDLPPAAAARAGRSGAATSRRTVTDGTSRRRRGRERPHGLMPAGPQHPCPADLLEVRLPLAHGRRDQQPPCRVMGVTP